MKNLASSTALGIALFLGLAGCSQPKPEAPPPPEVTVARPVARDDLADYEVFTGRVEAVETVDVRARVWGYLKRIHFEEGALVRKGSLLFEIDPNTYKAEVAQASAQVRLAEAQLAFAESDLKRTNALRGTGAVTQEDIEKAQRTLEVAQAQVGSAQADLARRQLDLDFTQITSPIDGRIGRTQVTTGNLVLGGASGSTLLATIVSTDPMYVYFDIDERTVLTFQKRMREEQVRRGRDERLTQAQGAATLALGPVADGGLFTSLGSYLVTNVSRVPLLLALQTDTGFPHTGFVDFVNNQIDASTGTLRVRGVVRNEQGIFTPGLFVRIRVAVGAPHRGLLISERALGTSQGQKFVYVVGPDNKVVSREVTLGTTHEGLREITGGLGADDRVIINGLLRVREGVVVQPLDGQMKPDRGAGQGSKAPVGKAG